MSSPILRLIAQRVLLGIVLLLAVSVLIFAGTQILPGDVAQAILGQSATPEALANLREQLGLNDPAWLRYAHWLWGILHGDFGTAQSSGLDIATSISTRLKNTMFLACMRGDRRGAAGDHPRPDCRALPQRLRRQADLGPGAGLDLVPGVLHRLSADLFLRREMADFPEHLDGRRRHAVPRTDAGRGAAGDRADAGGACPHDAHDTCGDPQRHAVGLYRDGGAERA